jgi:predicted TIM-barrel fold metal-dependent hydrolase
MFVHKKQACGKKMNPKLPKTIADFHVHLFPDRMFEAIWKAFVKDYGWKVIHELYWPDCLTYLRKKGVGPIVYSNYAHKPGVAGALNEFNLQVLENSSEVYCFAAMHPADEDALANCRDLFSHPKIMGVKLQLLVQKFFPHDKRLYPLFDLVMEKNKRILFHVGTGPVGNPFVGFEHFSRLMADIPDLPVNVAHMGGLEYKAFYSLFDRCPNLYMDTSFSFLPGLCCDLSSDELYAKKDRIVYGSDFPNLIIPRKSEIENLLALNLPDDFYEAVFLENAKRLIAEHCSG